MTLVRARRHGDRADAGGRFRRQARLGLRRRAAVRARRELRRARRPEAPGRRRARARADGAARRGLQPLRARRQLPARYAQRVLQPRASDAVGRGDQFRRRAQRARCASSSSTTRCTGSRSSTSTACGSTPCTRCTTDSRRTSSTSSRGACAAGRAATRHVHLVLENDAQRRGAADRAATRGAPRCATAQWNDDFHHALHVLRRPASATATTSTMPSEPLHLLGARAGRGLRLSRASLRRCATALRAASRAAQLPPLAFVNFLQNHDQVGNRALGERIAALAPNRAAHAALRALVPACCCRRRCRCCSWARNSRPRTPFLFFCDFAGELARAVTEGRRHEFRRFARFAEPLARTAIPDPNDESTFLRSKLNWAERDHGMHHEWLDFYRALLKLRRDVLTPWLPRARSGVWRHTPGQALHVRWPLGLRRAWHLQANLSDLPVERVPTGARRGGVRQRHGRAIDRSALVGAGLAGACMKRRVR